MFLLSNPMSVTADNPGPYRFVQAEIANFPGYNGSKKIKLSFISLNPTKSYPSAYWVNPPDSAKVFLQQSSTGKPGEFDVWIPLDYPADLSAIRFTLTGNDAAKTVSQWTLTGFPTQTETLPQIRDSQEVAPSVKVWGRASSERNDGYFGAILRLNPPSGAGWYWEGKVGSPYAKPNMDESDPSWIESKITDVPTTFYGSYPFLSLVDRVKAEGSISHFTSMVETVECQVKATPDPKSRPESQWWNVVGETSVTTPSGLQLLIHPFKGGFGYSGPGHKRWLMIGIQVDPSTFGRGLTRDPNRIDLDMIPKEDAPEDDWYRITHGASVENLKRTPRDMGLMVFDDMVSSDMTFKIRIDRRTMDRSLPFSLVLPLSTPNGGKVTPPNQVNP